MAANVELKIRPSVELEKHLRGRNGSVAQRAKFAIPFGGAPRAFWDYARQLPTFDALASDAQ
jgi:hypothetical protein